MKSKITDITPAMEMKYRYYSGLIWELVNIVSNENFKIEEWNSADTRRLQAITRFLEGEESKSRGGEVSDNPIVWWVPRKC